MICIEGLSKTFNKGKSNEVRALRDINITINDGDFLVIVGANGSGKSTLLNIIAGSILPGKGHISIDNTDVRDKRDFQRSRWIARVFQNPLSGTAPELSILENFRLAALRTQPKKLSIGADKAFEEKVKASVSTLGMGLEHKLDQAIGTLSGGQRQALTLLMSVMDDCRILLLDEPTAALDPRSAELVMKTADSIIASHHLTGVLVTHNLKDAYTYGNRIVQMAEGAVIKDLDKSTKNSLAQQDIFEWFAV